MPQDISEIISGLPPLREIISTYDLRADKKLGQNFILDQNITDKIARSAGSLEQGTVFEIGPGPGGLTRSILAAGASHLIAIEYDPRAVTALEGLSDAAGESLEIIHADALNTDLKTLSNETPYHVVANLPYNIATMLLFKWLADVASDASMFGGFTLMFQKEVVDRILAQPGTKAYGRLSVMTQWLCEARRAFNLSPSAFVPAPKVTSAIVNLSPRLDRPDNVSFKVMESVVAAAFNQRRKMIRSSLKSYEAALNGSGIEVTKRAEDLTMQDFIKICVEVEKRN